MKVGSGLKGFAPEPGPKQRNSGKPRRKQPQHPRDRGIPMGRCRLGQLTFGWGSWPSVGSLALGWRSSRAPTDPHITPKCHAILGVNPPTPPPSPPSSRGFGTSTPTPPPYFEGAGSISVLGLAQTQGLGWLLGETLKIRRTRESKPKGEMKMDQNP